MSNYVKEKAGIPALKEINELLEEEKIDYWLGRGVFRHYTLHKKLGDKLSDIDFHVWHEDRPRIQGLFKNLEELGYRIVADCDYKVNFTRPGVTIEIVYLNKSKKGKVFHESKGKFPKCDTDCFGCREMEMFGTKIRVPEAKYLPQVFGENWREEKEDC